MASNDYLDDEHKKLWVEVALNDALKKQEKELSLDSKIKTYSTAVAVVAVPIVASHGVRSCFLPFVGVSFALSKAKDKFWSYLFL